MKKISIFTISLLFVLNGYSALGSSFGRFGGEETPSIRAKETRIFWDQRLNNDNVLISKLDTLLLEERVSQKLTEKLIRTVEINNELLIKSNDIDDENKQLQDMLRLLSAQLEEQRKLNKIFESSR